MFQSRWGFHPCEYSTYRKLKFLNQMCLKAIRLALAWQRWHRKDPQNRIMHRRIRNEKGQTIGYESPISIAEPQICPMFSQKVLEKRHVDKKGKLFRDGFLDEKVATDDLGIAVDYAAARRPVKEVAEVRTLRLSVEAINRMYEQARRWLEDQDVK